MKTVFSKTRMGYVLVESNARDRWRTFATEGIGLHGDDVENGVLAFRMDGHQRRFIVKPGPSEDVLALGWQVSDVDTLKEILGRLRKDNIPVQEITGAEAQLRGIVHGYQILGPKRTLIELFVEARTSSQPLHMNASGFVTGDIGMGHVAITSKAPEAMMKFWQRYFDARHTDTIEASISGLNLQIEFMRLNPRHHSVAIAATKGLRMDPIRTRLQHINLEVATLDDVTNAYRRCRKLGFKVAMDVGLHTNDKDLSFYVVTPSGFQIECGWNPVLVEDETNWVPQVHQGISLWGHKPKDQTLGDKLTEARYALGSLFKEEYVVAPNPTQIP